MLPALFIVFALSGCGESNNPPGATVQSTVTIQETKQKVDDYMEQGRKALSPQAQLANDSGQDVRACDDPTDGGPKGRVFAQRDAKVLGAAGSDPKSNFDLLRKWWQENGFRVTTERPDAMFAEHATNSYRMSLTSNVRGSLYVGVSSPCVWPNGTPEPKE
jgi:hypothetical protein